MSEHFDQTINVLLDELKGQESTVVETKKLINSLCVRAKKPPMFSDADLQTKSGPSLTIGTDQFYGQPLAAAVRQILEMRRTQGRGPATINELYADLQEGGFLFDAKGEDNQKRSLRISISKNTQTFHRLPGPAGRIGLLEWYPNAKQPKAKKAGAEDNGDEDPAADDEVDPAS